MHAPPAFMHARTHPRTQAWVNIGTHVYIDGIYITRLIKKIIKYSEDFFINWEYNSGIISVLALLNT